MKVVMLLMGMVFLMAGCLVSSIAFSSEAATTAHIIGGVLLLVLGIVL